MSETIRIKYSNGEEREVESLDEAIQILEEQYPDVVIDYDDNTWQFPQEYREGVKTGRMLVWENEEIAGEPGSGDDGSHAVAEIIKEVA